uniref:Apoptosis antagonizing transcription factor n=1 Tax=Salmo trutta TaxID=8032 RepID=A0A673XQW8_SALTR
MAGHKSQPLEDLLNPLPKFTDPGDDNDIHYFGLRKKAITLLEETDKRYLGKATSREDEDEDNDDENEEKAEDDNVDDADLEDGEAEDGEDDDDEEIESDTAEKKSLVSKRKETDITLPSETDLHKLTEGMDHFGESEEEDDDEESGDEDGENEEDEDEEMEDEADDLGALLEGQIKMQKALLTANKLPQPHTFPYPEGSPESPLELQDQLLHQNPDTRPIFLGKTWGAHRSALPLLHTPHPQTAHVVLFQNLSAMTGRPMRCQSVNIKVLFLTVLYLFSQGFVAFDRNILTQVEQVLMDKKSLLRHTQTRRSEYGVLGKLEATAPLPETTTAEGYRIEQLPKANTRLKDLDEEIFDDFYHKLLRVLIEHRTSAADPNDQVKLRNKFEKKVATKASKRRQVS